MGVRPPRWLLASTFALDEKYTLTVTPEGFRLVVKGKRKGVELTWASIVGGDAALASALNASTLGARHASLPHSHTKH